jgi:hypothetical protein
MNNILFVSVFKNIGRDNWKAHFQRSQNHYINSFFKLTDIKYDMIVFLEKEMYDYLKKYELPSNIQLIVDDFKYFNELLPQFQEVMESENYKNLIPVDRKLYCEHSIPAYNVIMSSKFFYIKKAKEIFEEKGSNYEYYCWIDFGYIKTDNIQVPKNINFEKLKKDKILYLSHYSNEQKISPQEMLSFYHTYVCGNVFIVPSNLVSEFFIKVNYKIHELLKIGICDDDQSLILQVYYDYPDMFDLIHDESRNWYYIFEKYLNNDFKLPHLLIKKEINGVVENEVTNLLNQTLNQYNWSYTYTENNLEILEKMHENQIVILLNTPEIYCMRSPKAFKEAFQSFNKNIVVGMEITGNCSFTFPNPIDEYWKSKNLAEIPPRKYPTTVIAGYAKDLIKMYKFLETNNLTSLSNLSIFYNFINKFPNEIGVDVKADIFHISNFGLNAGILNIHNQKNDSPTFAEFFGRGAFFLILPHTHLNGQKVVSKYVQLMLKNNASDKTFRENYNYPEPSWNETF